jgi:hypothetical protein
VAGLNEWNGESQKALAHSIKRRIIECLQDGDLSFTELQNVVAEKDHGRFGYHLRSLKAFVELDPLTRKYRLTNRGRLLAGGLQSFRSITLLNQEYAKYVQSLSFGAHGVVFYTEEGFKRAVSFPFLKAGVARNEAVVYLVSESKLDLETREIEKYGLNLDKLPKEAFTLMSAYEWYLEKGKAQAETIIANWQALLHEKMKAGFGGLRAAAEMEVFVDYAKTTELLRYEALLGRQLTMNIAGLCLYKRDRFTNEQFVQAYNFHGHLISKGIAGKTIAKE